MDDGQAGRIAVDRRLLAQAEAAARAGAVEDMLRFLYASKHLDGLTRSVQASWGGLRYEEAEDAVAETVTDLLRALREGSTRITRLDSWLWKVADRKATAITSTRLRGEAADAEGVVPSALAPDAAFEEDGADRDPAPRDLAHPDQRLRVAVQVARRLIPRLELDSERRMVTVFVDAIEAGVEDLSIRQAAEIAGLSKSTADEALKRGLRKLERLARAEDAALDDLFVQIAQDEREGESDEDEAADIRYDGDGEALSDPPFDSAAANATAHREEMPS